MLEFLDSTPERRSFGEQGFDFGARGFRHWRDDTNRAPACNYGKDLRSTPLYS
jgi:hypothetical protein